MFLFTKPIKILKTGKHRKSGNLGIGYIERPWESALERLERQSTQAASYEDLAREKLIA